MIRHTLVLSCRSTEKAPEPRMRMAAAMAIMIQAAISAVHATAGPDHGPATGRKIALVNVRFDSDAANYLFYSEQRVTIRADVVEFVGE